MKRFKFGRVVFSALLGIMAVSLWISGCQKAERGEKVAKAKEKIVLWSYFETDSQIEAMDELIMGFNLSQNDYEASWEYVPMTEFTKKLSMAYTEKSLPDLAVIDNPDMAACIKMGMFEDVTEYLKELGLEENYYESLVQTVSYEGRLYGLPMNCNNVALIYNKKLLEENHITPPVTWEELKAAAAVLNQNGRSGFLMSAVEGEQGAFQILPWILSAGEDAGKIGGERTEYAFQFINGLIEDGEMTRNCINLSQTDVARVFIQGEAAMMENGPWVIPMLEQSGIDYGISRLPIEEKSAVIVGGENMGILKGKNVEGAKRFLSYYNQDAVMTKFCKHSCVLPTKKAVDISGQPGMEVFKAQMEGAVVRSSIPGWNSLSKQLSNAMYRLVAKEITPKEAARSLQLQQQ